MAVVMARARRAAGGAALALRRALLAPAPVVAAAVSMQLTSPAIVGNRLARRLQLHSTTGTGTATPATDVSTPLVDEYGHISLPAATAVALARLPPGHPATATLAAATSIDLGDNPDVTDAIIARLPPTLRLLDVSNCKKLTHNVSFTHLTALEFLDCSRTSALDTGLTRLPPSLQQLHMFKCQLPATANFSHLAALRYCTVTVAPPHAAFATLPASMEALDLSEYRYRVHTADDAATPTSSLAHLTQLRALHAADSDFDDAALAMLPPSLERLTLDGCRWLSPEASFARFPRLRMMAAGSTNLGDAALATLPPSLVSLNVSDTPALTAAAAFPNLPALRVLDVSRAGIGDAGVASMPAGLEELHMVDCSGVARSASLDHLKALRQLQSSGTDLSRATVAACRARGCTAPADGVLCKQDRYAQYLVVLPGSSRIVCNSDAASVALWDAASGGGGAAVAELRFKEHYVTALAALPDGRRVAVGVMCNEPERGGVALWDTRDAPHCPPHTMLGVPGGVRALAVLPNGHLLAGCGDGKLRVVDLEARAIVSTLDGHKTGVTAVAVLPSGGLAASASHHDDTVHLWDVATGARVATLEGHVGGVTSLTALPDGRIATGSEDATVRLWDVGRSTSARVLTGHDQAVDALALLPDGRLASASFDGTVQLWDTRRLAIGAVEVPVMLAVATPLSASWHGIALAPLPDGRLATGGDGVRLWQLPAA